MRAKLYLKGCKARTVLPCLRQALVFFAKKAGAFPFVLYSFFKEKKAYPLEKRKKASAVSYIVLVV